MIYRPTSEINQATRAELVRVAKQLGYTPTAHVFYKHRNPAARTQDLRHYVHNGLDYDALCAELGLDPPRYKPGPFQPEPISEASIDDIKRIAQQLKRAPTTAEYDEHRIGGQSTTTLTKSGHTFTDLCRAAGLVPNRGRISAMRTLDIEDMNAPGRYPFHWEIATWP